MIPVTGYDPSHSSEYRSLDCIVGALLRYQCSTSQGWKNTKEYWWTVNLGCLHWLGMQWNINMILPRLMQLLWKQIPSCTVAEHLKCGTFARPINRDRVLLPLVYSLSDLFHFLLMLTFVFFFLAKYIFVVNSSRVGVGTNKDEAGQHMLEWPSLAQWCQHVFSQSITQYFCKQCMG